MATGVKADEMKLRLADYLARASAGERILVEEDGVPRAALVSLADLRRLEARTSDAPVANGEAPPEERDETRKPPVTAEDDLAAREAAFRRALEEEGLVVRWPEGPPVHWSERTLLPPVDPPLSEQIIAERR